MGFALQYQGSHVSPSHLCTCSCGKAESPASAIQFSASLDTSFYLSIALFPCLWNGRDITFISLQQHFCSPSLAYQFQKQKGKRSLQMLSPYKEMLTRGPEHLSLVHLGRGRGIELLNERPLYLTKVGTAGPQKPGRGSLPPGRAPHPKSPCVSIALFKDSRLSKHPPSFSSSK